VLGKEGVEKVIDFPLTEEERKQMALSAESVRKNIAFIKEMR
jgi:malate/lactate dehydrogenase